MKKTLSEQQFAIIPTVVSGNQETVVVQLLKNAMEVLREVKTLKETQEVWHKVNALEALSKKFRLSKEVQLDATELRIRIERRLGEILSQKTESGEENINNKNQNSAQFDVDSEDYTSIISKFIFKKNDGSSVFNML